MVSVLLLVLLSSSPPNAVPCGPGQELVLDVAQWRDQGGKKATRCEAMVAAGFDVGPAWACNHGHEPKGGTTFSQYSVPAHEAPPVQLLCIGPSSGKCTQFIALRPMAEANHWCRISYDFPSGLDPAEVPHFEVTAEKSSVRVSGIPEGDCKVWQNGTAATTSCQEERVTWHWVPTARGLEVREPDLRMTKERLSALGAYRRAQSERRAPLESLQRAPFVFAQARSVGRVPRAALQEGPAANSANELKDFLWLGDQLCVAQDAKQATVRCYEPSSEQWGRRIPVDGSLARGQVIGSVPLKVSGRSLKLAPAYPSPRIAECHGFHQLASDGEIFELASLDVDWMLPRGEYPTRGVVRIILSPTARYGVALLPIFKRSSAGGKLPEGSLRCRDANIADWYLTSYELFVFATTEAKTSR